jgi:two-component system, OmpR family, sensor histidine kinase KdpD
MKPQNKIIKISIGKQYFFATVILFIFILILYYVQDAIGYQTVSLILLLIIFLLPLFNFERGPIILSAIISALAWDYYFIPPHFTMYIAKTEDIVTLFMFFIVAVTNGVLTTRLKAQKTISNEKERKSNVLYNLLKDLSLGKDLDDILKKAVQQIQKVFGFESIIFFPEDHNKLKREPHPAGNFKSNEMEWLAAETSFKNKTEAGKNTGLIQGSEAIYFPLEINDSVLFVIGIKIDDSLKPDSPDMELLRSFIKEISSFIEQHISYSIL